MSDARPDAPGSGPAVLARSKDRFGIPATPASPASARGWAWVTALLDLVFPPFCPVCQQRLGPGRRDPLCGSCWEGLERIAPPCCRVCGLPFLPVPSADSERGAPTRLLCGRCRTRLPAFTYARSAASYGKVAREAIHAFKFGGCRGLASPLGDLLAAIGMASLPERPDLLVPVPLHPAREQERGFNQSLLLARRLGRAWELPVRADILVRTSATAPQTELDARARQANVRGAFALRRPGAVAGRDIVLVDDVFTTGATVTACVQSLRRGGPRTVGVVTVARAL